MKHGLGGYTNHGCRCDVCRAAQRDYCREYSRRVLGKKPREQYVAEKRAAAEARDNHGTETRYELGCRCVDCRRASTDAKRQRRERSRVPCSHGCGTLVDSINRRHPEKPPECRSCASRRVLAERRLADSNPYNRQTELGEPRCVCGHTPVQHGDPAWFGDTVCLECSCKSYRDEALADSNGCKRP